MVIVSMNKINSLIHARLPRAGLGNKLLVWARAKVFGKVNNLSVITTGWSEIKIGPLLRKERIKRFYFGYFRCEHPIKLINLIYSYIVSKHVVEPHLVVQELSSKSYLYIFKETPYPDYFIGIREHRDLIRSALFEIVSKSVLNKALKSPPPVIGVHIRRSDFSEDVRTPSKYFIESIRIVRHIRGENLPVTIFSDAYPDELRDVLAVGNAIISPSRNALHDLISLSRSRCLILSDGSTFGYWAGFLADAPIILPKSLSSPIRAFSSNARYYEGEAQEDALLVQNIGDMRF